MKQSTFVTALMTFLLGANLAAADTIGNMQWADQVAGWSGDIQNYAGELMTAETSWWLTGRPDSDVDGNGYAWDEGDSDFVAGWRASGDASVTLYFGPGIVDGAGPDFVLHEYAGPNALASVWASDDGVDYVPVGQLGGGQPGYFTDAWFDLAGLLDIVRFVRVIRESSGSQTGLFLDALGAPLPSVGPDSLTSAGQSVVVPPPMPAPEPSAAVLAGLAFVLLAKRHGRRRPVSSAEGRVCKRWPVASAPSAGRQNVDASGGTLCAAPRHSRS